MKYIIPAFLLLIAQLSGCSEQPDPEKRNPFEGLWKLHAMEQQDPKTGQWREWRNGMQGYLLYDATDNAALHLTSKGYENTELVFPNFVDTIPLAALRHLTNSYVYLAKYTVNEEEGYVEHARFSHSNPADWNKVVRRRYTFKGDSLILQPMESSNSNLKLTWVRTAP